jgi:hypothetical protein
MAITLITEKIAEHVATGVDTANKTHRLGTGLANKADKAANGKRIFQFVGLTAGSNVVDIEASLDGGVNWAVWATGVSTDSFIIFDDGPELVRTNCTTYNSGTIEVFCQKFLEN